MTLNEQDLVTTWLSGNEVESAIFSDIEPINIYNKWCDMYDMDTAILAEEENTEDDYIETRSESCNWHMPDEYKNLDIDSHLRTMLCEKTGCKDFHIETMPEWVRVCEELQEFKKRNMIPVLQFLIYLVDVCKENNVVLGVGRGSSVASYILYLIGAHKVNSLKYNLDIKEFLK
jgi:DNA polymerase III alpha subunit